MSKTEYKLSLRSAILVNINIMLGAGIFINSLPLAKFAGALGSAVYAIVGIFMIPLVYTVATLLKIHPGGSFYTFAKAEINETAGFFTSWAYFTAKLASSTLMIHFFSLIVQSLIPIFSSINVITLDLIIICIFTILNMFNLKAGSRIQLTFMLFKMIPILFVILSGLFLLSTKNISAENIILSGIFPSIPLVIYAFTGFEAACSLSRHIKNPDKNAPKAIFISYSIVILILCSYQFLFYSSLGSELAKGAHYFEAFPMLLQIVFPFNDLLRFKLKAILQLAIASSALGGAYGILYSNNWNLYALVENKHVFFKDKLIKLNSYNIPFWCVIIESLFCISYLLITRGYNIPLQQIGAFGSTIAYTLSSIALIFACKKSSLLKKIIWIPIISLINCLILLGFCIKGFITTGAIPLYAFVAVVIVGMIMYFLTKKRSNNF